MELQVSDIELRGRFLRIAAPAGDGYRFLGDPETFLRGVRLLKQRIDIVTFMQRLQDTAPKFRYPMEWDNFAALPITSFEEWWTRQIGFKARNKAKQAQKKGVVIKEVRFDASLVEGIHRVYNECPIRQGRRFSHYGKCVEAVYAEEATFLDSSIFIGAFFGKDLIGFIKLVQDETGTQAGLMNIIAMIGHRDKSVTSALMAQAVRSCAQRGIRYLVYSNFTYGNKQRDGITDFKERNAFRRIDVPRYYVPLTALGALGLRLGVHRGLVDRIPQPVTVWLRRVRHYWYGRMLKTPTEAL